MPAESTSGSPIRLTVGLTMASNVECRSVLYMPASNERALAKGPTLACDVILLDLEDSVAENSKTLARQQAVQNLRDQDFGYRVRALRVNACDSVWHAQDLLAVSQCVPDVVVLPKVETPEQIGNLSNALDAHSALSDTRIWAMVESPMAVLNAQSIAASSLQYSRLTTLLIGTNDLALAAGMPVQPDRHFLVPWLMNLVAAAKAYDLQVVDAVYNDFSDAAGLLAECEQGVCMGMNGKSVIHPSQLQVANKAFSPTADQISFANDVVSAFLLPENANKGAIAVHGRMTERLHLGMAEQLLERVERLGLRG